jgi:hypothetical protein
MMKADFEMTLFDDAETRGKSAMLNRLELMFDDARNPLPAEYYCIADYLPFGKKIRVTFEVIE